MSSDFQDITVPGAPFSIRSILRFIRQEFGLPSIHLRGEIVHDKDGLILTLRNKRTDKVPSVRISQTRNRVEQLLDEGGRALLKLTSPSSLAIYAYYKFAKSTDQEQGYIQLVKLFEYCLSYPPATDDALAQTLWGAALRDLKRPEEAIEKFQKAIDVDPKFTYPYYNWGRALRDLKRPE